MTDTELLNWTAAPGSTARLRVEVKLLIALRKGRLALAEVLEEHLWPGVFKQSGGP